MKLFNKDNSGAQELVAVIGLISSDLDWTKWEPILPLGIRDVAAIIGSDTINGIDGFYHSGVDDKGQQEVVRLAQQSVAFFTWLKVIPTLDAQHDTAGRGKRLGENEQGMTALQEFKDEDNIRLMAYEAVDALIDALDAGEYEFWENSAKKKDIAELLIRDKEAFDRYYVIGSARLFVTLAPMIREVQNANIIPIITPERYRLLVDGDPEMTAKLLDVCCLPLALLTMKKAVERLPIEVLPNGIVQVQQSATIRDKLRAEKEARQSVAQSLGDDAAAYLQQLQDIIAAMDSAEPDYYISRPLIHSKGMTF